MCPHMKINWTLGAEWGFNEAFTGCLPELSVFLMVAQRAGAATVEDEVCSCRCVRMFLPLMY